MRTGYRHSSETIEKIRLSNLNRSQDAIERSRLGSLGKKRRPEARERMRLAALNRAPRGPYTPEQIEKYREVGRRRQYSPETRAKMSASAKAFFAKTGRSNWTPEISAKGRTARAVTEDQRVLQQFLRACLHRVSLKGSSRLKGIEITAILGYTKEELKAHIEKQFTGDMSWETHGRFGWHIDHKRPIASFVRAGISDPRIVNALENLQPLWAKDNHRKSATYKVA